MSRDPDAIQREIEHTREELAHTIDAIADRVNPKRAASRGAAKVKEAFGGAVDSVRNRGGAHELHAEVQPDGSRQLPPGQVQRPELAAEAGVPPGSPYVGADGQVHVAGRTQTVLRADRIAIAAAAGATVLAIWWLRRRRKS